MGVGGQRKSNFESWKVRVFVGQGHKYSFQDGPFSCGVWSLSGSAGKLTVAQIKAGYQSLKKIEDCIRAGQHGRALVEACNEFYTRIPHDFGYGLCCYFTLVFCPTISSTSLSRNYHLFNFSFPRKWPSWVDTQPTWFINNLFNQFTSMGYNLLPWFTTIFSDQAEVTNSRQRGSSHPASI